MVAGFVCFLVVFIGILVVGVVMSTMVAILVVKGVIVLVVVFILGADDVVILTVVGLVSLVMRGVRFEVDFRVFLCLNKFLKQIVINCLLYLKMS